MKLGKETFIWHEEKSVILSCSIGDYTIVHAMVYIGNLVRIGDNCKIQAFAYIPTGVTIGDRCFIGPRVTFTNDKYPPSGKENWLKTKVGNSVIIGAGAVICPGVTIGNCAFIGAGSVVTKDIPAGEMWVGNPARKLDK